MKHIVTAEQMRTRDNYTIKSLGIPSAVLMERAALGIAREVIQKYEELGSKGRVLCVCGTGNNGGDGAACARILHMKGVRADLFIVGDPEKFTAEMRLQEKICKKLGILEVTNPNYLSYQIIVDAMFGIGLSRDVEGEAQDVISAINDCGAYVISADIPSGINADTGAVMGNAVHADVTVTMQLIKPGLVLYPGALHAGRIVVEEIGILDDIPGGKIAARMSKLPGEETSDSDIPKELSLDEIHYLEQDDIKKLLPMRLASGNKGTFGKVLVIAGSKNMAGAAYFSALAAMRSGAGMVKILTAESNRDILQREIPEALLETYTNDEDVVMALDASLAWADVVCMGPGLGTTERSAKIVRYVLLSCSHPLVLDADGLNCLFGDTTLLSSYMGKLYVTPHMGEMGRLAMKSVAELKSDPISSAVYLARSCGVFTVMKDARTVIAQPDGSVYINVSGNSGMATAGSGDVLSGILASLLAQGTDPFAAAPMAALIHGLAGDAACRDKGERFMIASDIITHLSDVLK